jgi:hypothetical protein
MPISSDVSHRRARARTGVQVVANVSTASVLERQQPMQTVQIWDVAPDSAGARDAVELSALSSDETERLLEDVIVRRPQLLGRGMALVGRQVPTAGGPLDLLGVDEDGRLVVFELKRGLLTRDAVAQVLDYASDLVEKGEEDLARLIESNSGRLGIPSVEDFADWYSQQYPGSDGPLSQAPRMVIVGLGVDDRARRITAFLTQRSVEIQLLTFHAFASAGGLLLARLVEGEATKPPPPTPGQNKEANRRILLESAKQLGVDESIEAVATFVAGRLPGAYQWPGKTSYSFSLQEQTDAGRPTLRAYVTIYLDFKRKGAVLLNITPRASQAGGPAIGELVAAVGSSHTRVPGNQYVEYEIQLTPPVWQMHHAKFDAALRAIYTGWQSLGVREAVQPADLSEE